MIVFRGPSTGKALFKPSRLAVPMLVARVKCERVSRGNRTRAAKQRARVLAVAAILRAEFDA